MRSKILNAGLTLMCLVALSLMTAFTPVQAQSSLPVPGTVSGSLNSYGQINSYTFAVPTDGDVTFTVTTTTKFATLLRLKDSDGVTMFNYLHTGEGQTTTVTVPHMAPGATYHATMEMENPYTHSGNYQIQTSLAQPPLAKAAEPNNTPQTGIPLTIGTTVTGHVGYSTTSYYATDRIDYYKVQVPTDGDLTFTLTSDATLSAQLKFIDSDGTTLINYVYAPQGTTHTLVVPHLGPGATYYMSVQIVNNDVYGSYKVATSLAGPAVGNDMEKNDTYQTAETFPLNSTLTGHVGYSRSAYNTVDPIDYFKVTVSRAGNLKVTLSTDSHLNGRVTIWNTVSSHYGVTPITYLYTTQGNTNSVTVNLPVAGTYYISVEPLYGTYGGYVLSNAF